MATESSVRGKRMLCSNDVQSIVQMQPTAGKELIAEKLGIPPYNDAEDLQKAPFITFIYDNIMFAAEKGCPWDHVCLIVQFAHEYLKSILVENHQLPDAIKDFQKKSSILSPLSERHKKQYTDFIYETVLCHYNLYKFVFSHLRDTVKPKIDKEVLVPPTPLPLSQGQSVNVWEYQQKIKEIEGRQTEANEKLKYKMEKMLMEPASHKGLQDLNDVPLPYSKMALQELVNDVLKGYSEAKEKELKIRAEEVAQDLSFKLEKTGLPRPAVMGSPPRFKPKSPVGAKTNMNANSLKPDREKGSAVSPRGKSGRASAASNRSRK